MRGATLSAPQTADLRTMHSNSGRDFAIAPAFLFHPPRQIRHKANVYPMHIHCQGDLCMEFARRLGPVS